MKVDATEKNPAGIELIITNITSCILVLSFVIFLGAICRFFKRCWKKLTTKQKKAEDVTAFEPIQIVSPLRKCNSTSKLDRRQYSTVFQGDEIPFDAEEVTVQPELRMQSYRQTLSRPRAPTDPSSRPSLLKTISLPAYHHEHRSSIMGWTSQIDIMPSQLDVKLYKREASLQKFQARAKKKYATLDTEVYYDTQTSELQVKVNSIQQLITKEHHLATNLYVTVKKIPGQDVARTSIHTNAIDPVFNDEFTFYAKDDVSAHVLFYELYHMDKLSTSHLRGEAHLPLFQIDLSSRRRLLIPFIECRRTFLTAFHPAYRAGVTGCILISLQYQSWKDTIVINPVCVRNIPKKRHGTYGKDVYVKVVLRYHNTRKCKVKTKAKELEKIARSNTYQVTFNEPINLNINKTPAEECDITVSVNHYLFLKSSFIIGQVRLAINEPGYEATHFQSVVDCPGETISVWYEMRGFSASSAIDEIKK